jgi:Tfp pilus assembly protein PilV
MITLVLLSITLLSLVGLQSKAIQVNAFSKRIAAAIAAAEAKRE